MKPSEATPERPFYSVGYLFASAPYTLHPFTHWFEVKPDKRKRTMLGVDDEDLARAAADWLVTQPNVGEAIVSEHTGPYQYTEIYHVKRK